MAFYSYNKFRLIVLVLVVLIFWQIFNLVQSPPTRNEPNLEVHDSIEELEDANYNKHKIDRVRVKVYYEALCPDSRHFFIQHLLPVSDKLSEFLNITLVPYGKATTMEKNGKYTFKCQHGETECYANKIHACSVEKLHNSTRAVQFTSCMIDDNAEPDDALQRCGKQLSVETSAIRACANSDRGSILLKQYGDMTHAIDIEFIPTISLNDSLDHQTLILKNLLLAVCQKIAMPLPPPCL